MFSKCCFSQFYDVIFYKRKIDFLTFIVLILKTIVLPLLQEKTETEILVNLCSIFISKIIRNLLLLYDNFSLMFLAKFSNGKQYDRILQILYKELLV